MLAGLDQQGFGPAGIFLQVNVDKSIYSGPKKPLHVGLWMWIMNTLHVLNPNPDPSLVSLIHEGTMKTWALLWKESRQQSNMDWLCLFVLT